VSLLPLAMWACLDVEKLVSSENAADALECRRWGSPIATALIVMCLVCLAWQTCRWAAAIPRRLDVKRFYNHSLRIDEVGLAAGWGGGVFTLG
jgi:hypothetical protein